MMARGPRACGGAPGAASAWGGAGDVPSVRLRAAACRRRRGGGARRRRRGRRPGTPSRSARRSGRGRSPGRGGPGRDGPPRCSRGRPRRGCPISRRTTLPPGWQPRDARRGRRWSQRGSRFLLGRGLLGDEDTTPRSDARNCGGGRSRERASRPKLAKKDDLTTKSRRREGLRSVKAQVAEARRSDGARKGPQRERFERRICRQVVFFGQLAPQFCTRPFECAPATRAAFPKCCATDFLRGGDN